ncbi:MAG: plasmid maintenance system killer [Methyloligella sp.]|jgi:proteic killer suppression protein|nr:MAG: plasmid maintenance system killer [Methyloligella sp.]
MIETFKCKSTKKIFQGKAVKKFPQDIQQRAKRKLTAVDSVSDLEELYSPPGNRLEALSGDRDGQHSIRINEQWRICFTWLESGVYDVEITDYH